MSRFDGPHFYEEDSNIISIWIPKLPATVIPEGYFDENYSDDDDEPFNQFSSDFGFGYYDHDWVEYLPIANDETLEKFLSHFSTTAYNNGGIKNADHAYIMYDFKYDPKTTRIVENKYYKFIGCYGFIISSGALNTEIT